MNTGKFEQEFERYALPHKVKACLEDGGKEEMLSEMINAVKGVQIASELTKETLEAVRELENAQLVRSMSQLLLELSKVEASLAQTNRQVTALEEELAEIKRQKGEKLLIGEDGLYRSADGNGPYCVACYEGRKQAITLTKTSGVLKSMRGEWKCPICSEFYGKTGHF